MPTNQIAVAIVNYNTCALLHDCIVSAIAEQPAEIIVVDNASTDGSVAMVAAAFPQVVLHVNTEKSGFAAGANRAVATSSVPYVLLLNSDTVVQPGALAALTRYLDQHLHVGVVGPRLLNTDGSLQPSCFHFPTPLHAFLELSNLSSVVRHVPLVRQWYLRSWAHDRVRQVPWVLGAALAVRRTAFTQIGGFDESFFMYSEEVDFCFRLRQSGWTTHFAPVATVMHVGGASTVQQRVEMAVRALLSTVIFYRRHYSSWQLIQLKLILMIVMLAKLLRDNILMCVVRDPARRTMLVENTHIWKQVIRAVSIVG